MDLLDLKVTRFFLTIHDNVQRVRFILHDSANGYNHTGLLRLAVGCAAFVQGWQLIHWQLIPLLRSGPVHGEIHAVRANNRSTAPSA
jgi:hypothetical protein